MTLYYFSFVFSVVCVRTVVLGALCFDAVVGKLEGLKRLSRLGRCIFLLERLRLLYLLSC